MQLGRRTDSGFSFFFGGGGVFLQPMVARKGAVAGGVWRDRRAPVPITGCGGGVKAPGGVSEEYESAAAHCIQLRE